jgi:RNA polymerase sigma factor (sigma-70 family)
MGPSPALAVDGDEQADEALIQQVLDGNTALFELLMRRYNERVYRAARSIVRDEHETEDVMQQVYVNAFTHLRQFNGAARFSTWLTRIAVNEALARVRRQGRYDSFDEQHSKAEPFASHHPADDPERQAFAQELRGLLEHAIDSLPNGMREVGMDPRYAMRSATRRYRTTPLRGLLQHAPYFHDGSAADLPAVVEHYNSQFRLNLTARQKADLVEYLKSL